MPQPTSSLTARQLLATEFPPLNYVIGNGLLPEKGLLIVGGPPKSYKSFLLNTLAFHLVTGTHLFDTTRTRSGGQVERVFNIPKPQRVLYFEQEVGPYGMQSRLRPMIEAASPEHRDAILDNLIIHSKDCDLRLDTKEGVKRFDTVIKPLKPDVVFIDPMVEYHTSDENSTKDISVFFHNLDKLRADYGFHTTMSHHAGKTNSQNPRSGPDLLRGNSFIFGKGDSFMMLRPTNPDGGIVRVEFTLRQDRPIHPLELKLDWTELRAKHHKWCNVKDPKIKKLDDELGQVM